jgi:ornithine cyclodeaminase
MDHALDAEQTAALLPYGPLADEVIAVLRDDAVQQPPRIVLPLAAGARFFAMPAADAAVVACKLISYTPRNAGRARPVIQGDVVVFDVAGGERRLMLHGATVTARRTAAVSLAAARLLAPHGRGPLGIIGAGVQGLAHLEAFAAAGWAGEVHLASRSPAGLQRLAAHAQALGCRVYTHNSTKQIADECIRIATCTPASMTVLDGPLRDGVFVAAVGGFAPEMIELAPALAQWFARAGRIVVDDAEALQKAGDLLQAGIDLAPVRTLAQCVREGSAPRGGPVLFKSVGCAAWDLAAARLALRLAMAG